MRKFPFQIVVVFASIFSTFGVTSGYSAESLRTKNDYILGAEFGLVFYSKRGMTTPQGEEFDAFDRARTLSLRVTLGCETKRGLFCLHSLVSNLPKIEGPFDTETEKQIDFDLPFADLGATGLYKVSNDKGSIKFYSGLGIDYVYFGGYLEREVRQTKERKVYVDYVYKPFGISMEMKAEAKKSLSEHWSFLSEFGYKRIFVSRNLNKFTFSIGFLSKKWHKKKDSPPVKPKYFLYINQYIGRDLKLREFGFGFSGYSKSLKSLFSTRSE